MTRETILDKQRHLVKHEYHDHAFDYEENLKSKKHRRGPRGGVTTPFPVKLHNLLEENLHGDVISWQPHGRCFILRKPKQFLAEVMPKHFKQTKLTSFQRQLNLYGFSRLTSGPDKGGYYHELFLRGKEELCTRMVRTRIKGTRTKGASNPDSEPNFYAMPSLEGTASSEIMETLNLLTSAHEKRYTHQQSPVCVSTPGSVSSISRPNSPVPNISIGMPYLPVLPDETFSMPNLRLGYMDNYALERREDESMPPKHSLISDCSSTSEPLIQEDALIFEGKEFHYLDSLTLLFDNDDGNIENILEANTDEDLVTGLTFGPDGKLCGFDA
eukprot:CAMPEP_0176477208 /NCGR_PEP_ID=MMETSP0200_2-20121128/490_1 /TAXON_ID=947934 /ORGANISM="Chaetoceros sp., Strain GSL56" /LENGTH=327 /DNA_ID=CAMNT_0017872983 /DNA_START=280 /DNA_END=1263 /DNA_ORIENTATION=+